MKSTARTRFDLWAESYDRSLLHHFLFRPSYLVFMEEIARWHDRNPRPFRVLDVGCGTGELAALLAASNWPVQAVGLDYSPSMCELAAAKAERIAGPDRPGFVAGDSEFLPFASGSFDVVACSNSFHHYPHQADVVHEARRLLRPGGQFILIDGFRDNVIGWVVFDVIVGHIEKDVHHAPWSQIDGYFRDAGFVGIRRRKFNFWMPLCATIGEAPEGP